MDKLDCVAVLGRGEDALDQLYDWLKWFDENNFHYKDEPVECVNEIELLMGRDHHHKMVLNDDIKAILDDLNHHHVMTKGQYGSKN